MHYIIFFRSCDIIDLTLIDSLPLNIQNNHKTNKQSNPVTTVKLKDITSNKLRCYQPPKLSDKEVLTNESNNLQHHSPPRLTHSFKELRRSNVKDGKAVSRGKLYSAFFSFYSVFLLIFFSLT